VIFALLTILMVCDWQHSQWKDAIQDGKYEASINNLKEQLEIVSQKIESNKNNVQTTQSLYTEAEKLSNPEL
jgi:hypothetical protein